ncbi:Late secretory pathway protein AVL9-like protein, partial [Ophiophagus hannah]
RVWNSNKHPALAEINPSHPFQGQYSVSDVKLRLSHSVQNSERGKKIGNAMVTTSRNVVQTGRAVEASRENESILGTSGVVDPKMLAEHILDGQSSQTNEEEGEELPVLVDARVHRAEICQTDGGKAPPLLMGYICRSYLARLAEGG